jgi:hypothetical protein
MMGDRSKHFFEGYSGHNDGSKAKIEARHSGQDDGEKVLFTGA